MARPRQPDIMRRLDVKSRITLQRSPHVRRDVIEVVQNGEPGDVEVDGHVGGEDVVEEVEAALVDGDGEGVESLLDCHDLDGSLRGDGDREGRRELLRGGDG